MASCRVWRVKVSSAGEPILTRSAKVCLPGLHVAPIIMNLCFAGSGQGVKLRLEGGSSGRQSTVWRVKRSPNDLLHRYHLVQNTSLASSCNLPRRLQCHGPVIS